MTPPLAWLLDANVVSEMMRPTPEPRVAAFLAAAAASRGLSVVTRNTSEFRNTGIGTVNPWTAG